MRAFLLSTLLLAFSCGDLKSHSGGGGGGGTATGGGGFSSTGGGGSAIGGGTGGGGFPIGGGSGTGGGVATGGGGVATGGGSATGGGGPQNWNFDDAGFTFTEVVPEPNSSNHGDYDRITGLTFNDIWISDSYGFLRHYDGFSWSLIYDYGISVRYSGLTELSSGELFASTDTAILDCPSDCTDAGSFITHGYGSTYAFTGMCTNGTEVYVSGGSAADGPLVVRVAPGGFSQWQEWHSGLPAQHVGGCAVSSKGEVLVGLADAIGVFDSDGGFHVEDAGTDILSIWWTAMAAVGDTVVAGADEKRVAVRDAQGGWTPLVDGPNGDFSGGWINAASGGTDAILVGTSSFSSGPVSVVHDGQVTLMLQPSDTVFFGIWAQSNNSFWLTGHDSMGGTAAGVLYRADR